MSRRRWYNTFTQFDSDRGGRSEYRTTPEETPEMPPGVPYIVCNEAAERFSFYGMKTILVVFMQKYMLDAAGRPDRMTDEEARSWYHTFSMAVYLTPLLGACVSDVAIGKFRTILYFSIVYCGGHLALALNETRTGLGVGLALISLGAGGIKPCVSANVGDQFGAANQHLLTRVFGWFYFSINLGAFLSSLITPALLDAYGPHLAFGLPGVLMGVATVAFWLGRRHFVHAPPAGPRRVLAVLHEDGLAALGRLLTIYVFVAVFWSLYDQSGSAWVQQADRMDRHFFGVEWLASQVQAVNALLILLYIPLFNGFPLPGGKGRTFRGIYGAVGGCVRLTPLRKMGAGFFLTALAFFVSTLAQMWIEAADPPSPPGASAPAPPAPPPSVSIGWQLLAYVLLTAAEILVSITCLEFSYTQAPPALKSWVMAVYLCSVSAGNAFTALVNAVWPASASDVQYYGFFTALMLATALAFVPVASCYQEKSYLPHELPPPSASVVNRQAGAPNEAEPRPAARGPAVASAKQTELANDQQARHGRT